MSALYATSRRHALRTHTRSATHNSAASPYAAHTYAQRDAQSPANIAHCAHVRTTGHETLRQRRAPRMHTRHKTHSPAPASHTAHMCAQRDTRPCASVARRACIRATRRTALHQRRTPRTSARRRPHNRTPSPYAAHAYAQRDARSHANVAHRTHVRTTGHEIPRQRRAPRMHTHCAAHPAVKTRLRPGCRTLLESPVSRSRAARI
ncbi:hypothetical protein D2E22_1324 [Bifidobacterium castoris]|uniref:Uncharacterized protein n=1 Tax=Bifidobacterium castoris TaxID=2306972 RepID=A0A430F6X0_9BIFI|nr:hypothetical protein D2E22_1324 [Bifidobacterium castoris]